MTFALLAQPFSSSPSNSSSYVHSGWRFRRLVVSCPPATRRSSRRTFMATQCLTHRRRRQSLRGVQGNRLDRAHCRSGRPRRDGEAGRAPVILCKERSGKQQAELLSWSTLLSTRWSIGPSRSPWAPGFSSRSQSECDTAARQDLLAPSNVSVDGDVVTCGRLEHNERKGGRRIRT